MADSIKELIMKDIVVSVQKIKAGLGYSNTFENSAVERNKTTPINASVFPAAFIYEGAETVVEREQMGDDSLIILELPVSIEAWCYDANNLSECINSLEADVIKAVMTDHTRGGNAHCTQVIGSEPFLVEGKNMGGRIISFLITYECREKDPTQH